MKKNIFKKTGIPTKTPKNNVTQGVLKLPILNARDMMNIHYIACAAKNIDNRTK